MPAGFLPWKTFSIFNIMLTNTSLEEFYKRNGITYPTGLAQDTGHFNVFEPSFFKGKRIMPYSRRAYYKISWLRGKSRAEYADKTIEIENNALLFATPRIPYHWIPTDADQTGMFCIFTADFLMPRKSGIVLEDLPLFQPGNVPIFNLSDEEATEVEYIFKKMQKELHADYRFKFDLLRNLVMELIHYGQKLQPLSTINTTHNASQRISMLFLELLERQFPLESPEQRLGLRTPKEYADRLAVHVNHLNKVLKEATGRTTSEIISNRLVEEAKILLKQTSWSIADIAYSLGFDEVSHFSNYFKKQTSYAPLTFRT
jgi:AraC-like DNA-binding protein